MDVSKLPWILNYQWTHIITDWLSVIQFDPKTLLSQIYLWSYRYLSLSVSGKRAVLSADQGSQENIRDMWGRYSYQNPCTSSPGAGSLLCDSGGTGRSLPILPCSIFLCCHGACKTLWRSSFPEGKGLLELLLCCHRLVYSFSFIWE